MNKVLIIGPAWVGDMVMSQTLLRVLKQDNPDTQIDVLAPAWTSPLLNRMPEVNQALVMPLGHGQLRLSERYKLGKQLREQQYDQAFVLPNSFKSALIPFWAKIPKRTGWAREGRGILLNDARRLDKNKYPLMIQRFTALTLDENKLPEKLPRPKLTVDKNSLETSINKFNLKVNKPILALCPGAEFGAAKRWPEQHYAAVAQEKLAQGWQVWLFGSHNDQAVAAAIQANTNSSCIDLTGQTSLGEAIDLLSVVDTVVSNDSGLMHIAAALDKPLVVVYGSSDPSFTPPLTDTVKILSLDLSCSPCFKRTCPLGHLQCLNDLKPQRVINALNELSA